MIITREKSIYLLCFILLFLTVIFTMHCSMINQIVNVQKPTLTIQRTHITNFTFDSFDLLFDIKISNPNALSASLDGFDYDLKLNNVSFISGEQDKKLEIQGMGESIIQLPLTFNFKDIYRTYQNLHDKDSSTYELACGLLFEVPMLGKMRVPINHQGDIPLVRLPSIKIKSLKLNSVNFSGAHLDLNVELDNPNTIDFLVNNFTYNFLINNLSWAQGDLQQETQIRAKNKNIVTIPINLNFSQMGETLYHIIIGNQNLNYSLSGNIDLQSNLPLISRTTIPFDGSGQLSIVK